MLSSTIPRPGDVVILPFDFLDGSGKKDRPAVALTSYPYNSENGYFVFAPLTGSAGNGASIVEIIDLNSPRLTRRTYAHGLLFTAQNKNVLRIPGHLASQDLAKIRNLIKQILLL